MNNLPSYAGKWINAFLFRWINFILQEGPGAAAGVSQLPMPPPSPVPPPIPAEIRRAAEVVRVEANNLLPGKLINDLNKVPGLLLHKY